MKVLIKKRVSRGFSLVATMTMMILLSLIAVGLLSLSVTTIRSSQNNLDYLEARSNARLAMQIAIAQLQETMGPDQAVSASADTVLAQANQPHLLGTWQSWSWDPLQDSNAPDYQAEKQSRFSGWLTSQRETGNEPDLAYASSSVPGSSILMLGEGSFGTSSDEQEIRSELVPLQDENADSTGHYAWTVLAEDTKARIDLTRDENRPTDSAHLASSLTFPERSHREALELGDYDPPVESDWAKLISNRSLDVAAGSSGEDSLSKQHFFDFTTYSRGVLADVANGGLKRDLTTILEENLLDGQRIYSGEETPFGTVDPHWSYLSDYYQQYLRFQGEDATSPIDVTDNIENGDFNEFDSSPESLTLKPIVAKLQIIFSMVTHPLSVRGTNASTNAYNQADPTFEGQHLRPWLVFEPVITLWNPYSVPITFDSLSLGLDKIPVAFRFAKIAGRTGEQDLRAPSGESNNRIDRSFWPLSQFVWNGNKEDAISNFSFNVRGGNMADGLSRDPITLQPGENKVFSAFIREGSTWGSVLNDFMIQGSSSVGSTNRSSLVKEIDVVEGYNPIGGFRFDHLARFQQHRNVDSLYTFERNDPISAGWFHWAALRPQDSIVVKAMLANNDANSDNEVASMDNFTMLVEVDRAGGISSSEILGSSFTVRETDRLYDDQEDDFLIERAFPAATILQEESATTREGKTPFAVFTMTAKSTNDILSPTKGWLFGNPVLTAYSQDENIAPQAAQSYEFSFREVASANEFPGLELDPSNNRGYFGSGQSARQGLTATPMFSLPTNPMVSIGQFQAANLISAVQPPFFNYPLGNSHAHPLLAPNSVVSRTFVDHSYLLNQRLWDSFYFSGLSKGTDPNNRQALTDFFEGENTLTPRLQAYQGAGVAMEEAVAELSGDAELASRELAGYQMLEGAFNIHSTSVRAWKALLMSAFEAQVPSRDNEEHEVIEGVPFARLLPSYSEDLADLTNAAGTGDVGQEALRRAERWLGFHELNEEQCERLAENIVEQIKLRCAEDEGPFLSFSEFVNRRVANSGESFTDRGVLQTAIDLTNDPNGNASLPGLGEQGELFSLEDGVGVELGEIDDRIINPEALVGNTAEGSPATLIQGDLLQQIGSVISVRSDTFRVRSYGNSVARNGQVKAEAWCEAIVQRVPDFVDSSQSPGTEAQELNAVNQNFGRRFEVVSFRWLASQEV